MFGSHKALPIIIAWLVLLVSAPAAFAGTAQEKGQQRVVLADARATIDLGAGYDFYPPAEARRIMIEIWGNAPEEADGVLGLIMPAGQSPMGDAWGAVVRYEDIGHVADDRVAAADYDALLEQMRTMEDKLNRSRAGQGYPTITVSGWAERPHYDPANHSLVWARDLAFSDSVKHTLNYEVRLLGRDGVLSLNFLAVIDRLPQIREAAATIAARTRFDPGASYADFDPDRDRLAAYGLAGLVAQGSGLDPASAPDTGRRLAMIAALAIALVALTLLTTFYRRRMGAPSAP